MSPTTRHLFGGAITIDLPGTLIDASDLRQIPDNQEVFLSPMNDVTFIIEILEKIKVEDLSKAAEFHFDSLAHDNDARSKSIEKIIRPLIPSTREHPAPTLLVGIQHIQKFNRVAGDDVLIYLALFRLEKYNIDIILSCNIPVRTGNPETTITGDHDLDDARAVFEHAANSFTIRDYDLFVGDNEN